MGIKERIYEALEAQMIYPERKCNCCAPEPGYRPRSKIPADPEGDRLAESIVRHFQNKDGSFKIPHQGLTMAQKRAMLGPKATKRWDGGSPP